MRALSYRADVTSWKNATPSLQAQPRPSHPTGLLRPAETAAVANLHRDHPVSAPLQPYVERYWSVSWDLDDGSSHRSEVLPAPAVNLSVETGDRPRFGVDLPAVLVHAVVTRRFRVDLVGSGRVTAAKFRPGGFAALTGDPPPPRNSVQPLGAQLSVEPATVLTAVLAEPGDAERAAALDVVLARLAPPPPAAYLELVAVLDVMRGDRALVRVEDVAERAGMTVRSLQRLFTSYVGVGCKAVLARYRLQDAVAAIDNGDVDDLATLAASLGWFDQAHFSREFRALVGTTPSAYLSRQVSGGDAHRDSP
jgi:AraC-like DNA-binding protein